MDRGYSHAEGQTGYKSLSLSNDRELIRSEIGELGSSPMGGPGAPYIQKLWIGSRFPSWAQVSKGPNDGSSIISEVRYLVNPISGSVRKMSSSQVQARRTARSWIDPTEVDWAFPESRRRSSSSGCSPVMHNFIIISYTLYPAVKEKDYSTQVTNQMLCRGDIAQDRMDTTQI